jgi:hypothetical protein
VNITDFALLENARNKNVKIKLMDIELVAKKIKNIIVPLSVLFNLAFVDRTDRNM